MADSLLASLFGMLDSRTVDQIAACLSAPEQSILQGLKSSVASVLGGMASKSEDPNVLHSILDLTPSSSGDITMSQVARAASDPNSPIISGGKRILSALFGKSETAVADAVSGASGLRSGTTSTLLALAAPMVMSFLSKRVRTEGMDMRGLGALLQRESGAIRNALPAGLADTLWTPIDKTAAPVMSQTVAREHASSRWLPLLALAVLVPALVWLMNHGRRPAVPATAPVTTETTPLGTANRAVTDSVDIVKGVLPNDAGLQFEAGSATLRPESQAPLDGLAVVLKRYPDVHLKVTGYASDTGIPDQNMQLSQKRADTIVNELVRRGVPADQMAAQGGGQYPTNNSATGIGQARNREVTLDAWRP